MAHFISPPDPDDLVLSASLEADEDETFFGDPYRTFEPFTRRWMLNPETHAAWAPMLIHDRVIVEVESGRMELSVQYRNNDDGDIGTFRIID